MQKYVSNTVQSFIYLGLGLCLLFLLGKDSMTRPVPWCWRLSRFLMLWRIETNKQFPRWPRRVIFLHRLRHWAVGQLWKGSANDCHTKAKCLTARRGKPLAARLTGSHTDAQNVGHSQPAMVAYSIIAACSTDQTASNLALCPLTVALLSALLFVPPFIHSVHYLFWI